MIVVGLLPATASLADEAAAAASPDASPAVAAPAGAKVVPEVPPGPWARLSSGAGWKAGGFFFSFSVIATANEYDLRLSDWTRDHQPVGMLSTIADRSPPYMLGGTLGTLGGLTLFGPKASRPRHRKSLEVFVVSQLINAGLTDLLKIAVARPRPDSGARNSFPSGHTSSAAAWATFLWRRYGWKAGLPATLFATLVGFSRIQDRRHYLSDVLAGAVLGVSITYVVDERYGP